MGPRSQSGTQCDLDWAALWVAGSQDQRIRSIGGSLPHERPHFAQRLRRCCVASGVSATQFAGSLAILTLSTRDSRHPESSCSTRCCRDFPYARFILAGPPPPTPGSSCRSPTTPSHRCVRTASERGSEVNKGGGRKGARRARLTGVRDEASRCPFRAGNDPAGARPIGPRAMPRWSRRSPAACHCPCRRSVSARGSGTPSAKCDADARSGTARRRAGERRCRDPHGNPNSRSMVGLRIHRIHHFESAARLAIVSMFCCRNGRLGNRVWQYGCGCDAVVGQHQGGAVGSHFRSAW